MRRGNWHINVLVDTSAATDTTKVLRQSIGNTYYWGISRLSLPNSICLCFTHTGQVEWLSICYMFIKKKQNLRPQHQDSLKQSLHYADECNTEQDEHLSVFLQMKTNKMPCSIITSLSVCFKVRIKTNSSLKKLIYLYSKVLWICKYESYRWNIKYFNFSSVQEFSTSRYVKKLCKGNIFYVGLWKTKKKV